MKMKKAVSVLLAVSVLSVATAAMAVGGSAMAQEKFNRTTASDALAESCCGYSWTLNALSVVNSVAPAKAKS